MFFIQLLSVIILLPEHSHAKLGGYVCPLFNKYSDEYNACLTNLCYRNPATCCSCDKRFLYEMYSCGMSCPDNYYVCMQQQSVFHPQPNDNCFHTNPGSRSTSADWSYQFWRGFISSCVQGELKQTCGGKLALAGQTFKNDFQNFQNAWNSQANEMTFQTPVLPEACRNFTGPVGRVFNVLHATAGLLNDVAQTISACGGRIVGVLGEMVNFVANTDKALCGIVNHYVQMEQEWLATIQSWTSCISSAAPISPPEPDLCYAAGQHFAAYVKAYFDGAVC